MSCSFKSYTKENEKSFFLVSEKASFMPTSDTSQTVATSDTQEPIEKFLRELFDRLNFSNFPVEESRLGFFGAWSELGLSRVEASPNI